MDAYVNVSRSHDVYLSSCLQILFSEHLLVCTCFTESGYKPKGKKPTESFLSLNTDIQIAMYYKVFVKSKSIFALWRCGRRDRIWHRTRNNKQKKQPNTSKQCGSKIKALKSVKISVEKHAEALCKCSAEVWIGPKEESAGF